MAWRGAAYRLMVLTPSGQRVIKARGSLIYLRRLGGQARTTRGRQWIELNLEPAVRPQTTAAGVSQ